MQRTNNPNAEQQLRSPEFAPPPESQESMWSMLAFIWRRKGIVLFALMLGLGAGYLYFLKQVPVYMSAAQILVVEQRPKLPVPGMDLQKSTSDKHIRLITSHRVIEMAIQKGKLDQLPSLRNSGDPFSAIAGGFFASADGNSEILNLRFTSSSQDDCKRVVDAMIVAYQDFLGEVYQQVSKETEDLIREAKDQLDQQLSEKEEEYRKFRDTSPLLVAGEKSLNIHESRLPEIESVISARMLENTELQAKIEAVKQAVARGSSREAIKLMLGGVEELRSQNSPEATQQESPLFSLKLEEQLLLEQYGVDHPKVQAIRKRIEFTKQHIDTNVAKVEVASTTPTKDFCDLYIESLRERIQMNQQTIKEMTTRFEKEKEIARSLSSYQLKEQTFRSEIDRKSRLFDVVLERLEQIRLITDQEGADIQVLHAPSEGAMIRSELRSMLMYASVLAMMCGLGLAFVVDAADRRFRNPDEIRNHLGVSVIGHIPVIPDEKKNKKQAENLTAGMARPEMRTIHSPKGRIAEAYRAVRTAVYFNIRNAGSQVIQVTSPSPGDGKTTLATNLAVSIAQSGKKVLLIDADFRRPRCHKMFGASDQVGMSAVIEGTVEWTEAVQTTEVENLSLLACGKRPENPSELLTSRRFEELLSLFREKFDLVIVDTPPILAVTDPLNVAPRVDGIIVVLRLSKSARSSSKRTLDILEEVGGNVLGVVVNGVGAGQTYGADGYRQYGYGYSYNYGQYGRYGYGRRYGYGSYGYSDDQNYYTDDKEETNGKAKAKVPQNGNGQAV